MVYCALWVNWSGIHVSGGGSAGGYGYNKVSAAFSEAVNNAGIVLEPVDGAEEDAVAAITRKVTGKRKVYVHVANA